MIFFCSDTHFHHKNIISYQPTRRMFSTIEDMNAKLIENWNLCVGPDDTIYHLGDFSFAGAEKTNEIMIALNGHKHLIKGNHENKKTIRGFESVQDYLEIKVGEQLICMFHYPISTWKNSHYGSWHLHGHSHGSKKVKGKRLDVGVDCHNMAPISFLDVQSIMDSRAVAITDYHGRRE